MSINLTDDGTLDTVLRCSECGEEFRYNFDGECPDSEPDCVSADQHYQDFIEWAIEDTTQDHECAESEVSEGSK